MSKSSQSSVLRERLKAIIDEPMSEDNFDDMVNDITSYLLDRLMPVIEAHTQEAVRQALEDLKGKAYFDVSGSSPLINPREIDAVLATLTKEKEL